MKLRLTICAMAAGTALFATDVTTYTYGVLAVTDNTSSNTVIGVPWRQVNDLATPTDISLSNLVSTTTLMAGDVVYLYEDNTWKGYTLSAAKVWVPTVTIKENTIVSPDAADAKFLSRGTGLIIQRASTNDAIYLCGRYQPATGLNSSISSGGTALIANPTTTAKTIDDNVGSNGDQIRVPLNGGGLKIYEKRSGAWCTEVRSAPAGWPEGMPAPKSWKSASCTLEPGMGAWYVVKSGNSAVSISW